MKCSCRRLAVDLERYMEDPLFDEASRIPLAPAILKGGFDHCSPANSSGVEIGQIAARLPGEPPHHVAKKQRVVRFADAAVSRTIYAAEGGHDSRVSNYHYA